MKVKFQDYYGRHLTIHNNTCSGNVYVEVVQTESLNDVRHTSEERCTVKSEFTLNSNRLRLLIAALTIALEEDE